MSSRVLTQSVADQSVADQLNLRASDDASHAFIISLKEILTGDVALAFGHPLILQIYFKSIGNTDPRFEFITNLAMVRNIRLILKINERIQELKAEGVIDESIAELVVTEEMRNLYEFRDLLQQEAIALGIDPSKYYDEEFDSDDVGQCTNSSERSKIFNFDQQLSVPGEASDNVWILHGSDGDFLVVIKRAFGPGRGCCAFAGGLKEKFETNKECAMREGEEEVQMTLHGLQFKSSTFEMEPLFTRWWDPRARFSQGMINGALVTRMDFGDMSIL